MTDQNYPDLNIYDVRYTVFKDGSDGPFEEECVIGVLAPSMSSIEAYLKEFHLPNVIRMDAIGYGNSGEVFHVITGSGTKQPWE